MIRRRNNIQLVAALTILAACGVAQTAALTPQQEEAFLKTAKVVTKKDVSKGVTGTRRVTLSDGKLTHDASFQTIDKYLQVFQPQGGKAELNFKDS